jgi:molecular chaperone IbpA
MTKSPLNIFDEIFANGMIARGGDNYPPTNIIELNGTYVVEVAVAGFSKDELSVDFTGKALVVAGKKVTHLGDSGPTYTNPNQRVILQELAQRAFRRSFVVSGQFNIDEPVLKNGLLTITLRRIVDPVKKLTIRGE